LILLVDKNILKNIYIYIQVKVKLCKYIYYQLLNGLLKRSFLVPPRWVIIIFVDNTANGFNEPFERRRRTSYYYIKARITFLFN